MQLNDRLLRRRIGGCMSLILVAGMLAACGSKSKPTGGVDAPNQPDPKPPVSQPTAPPATQGPARPAPARPAAELTGTVAVMVENSSESRPQTGLEKADLVFELESEYGVSRFMALFYYEAAEKIGPVRSARMGFYDIAGAYGLPYAHAGGSNEVLIALKEGNHTLLNFDEIYTCGGCFWRSRDRVAPHNLYTSTELLVNHANVWGWYPRALEPLAPETGAMAGGQAATAIAYNWGKQTQAVEWSWQDGKYWRSQDGAPHVMESGEQIAVENVVLLFTDYYWDAVAQWGHGLNSVDIMGSGDGLLYQDGRVHAVTWNKPERNTHYQLTTRDGKPVTLDMGRTWVSVLKSIEHVGQGRPAQ